MNQIAESYVRLVLAVGQHDADYVDAYYGPPEWKAEAQASKPSLASISSQAAHLAEELTHLDTSQAEETIPLRHQSLLRQLQSLHARVQMLSGRKYSFDEEALALYDAAPPHYPESHFTKLVHEVDLLLPGKDPLIKRYETYKKRFIIPIEKLDTVFSAVIAECRSRTKKHIPLPAGESFAVEYVKNKSWSGYNWYKGNCYSVIQINTDLPISIDRAVDLAAHEGYPGHHVYNSILEDTMVRTRKWMEYSVYPLFSPQSLIAEGTANFGIEVAFSPKERIAFERDVLFPLAELDPNEVDAYYTVFDLVAKLSYAGNEAARQYLNGQISRTQAAEWLVSYALMPKERAEQRVRFFDQYRSYVINYNLGQDLVRRYIELRGGTPDNPVNRWKEFLSLLSSPRVPSSLQ